MTAVGILLQPPKILISIYMDGLYGDYGGYGYYPLVN